jgi:hypothetical protein
VRPCEGLRPVSATGTVCGPSRRRAQHHRTASVDAFSREPMRPTLTSRSRCVRSGSMNVLAALAGRAHWSRETRQPVSRVTCSAATNRKKHKENCAPMIPGAPRQECLGSNGGPDAQRRNKLEISMNYAQWRCNTNSPGPQQRNTLSLRRAI